ncbi:autotransporter outer membrane beta-barrel domain-containing protein [Candidatus Chlamydia sanziniae]|uniref:autotransporter outer membrane beta-barrel domain-containing protein n=1 Tax=Candidatus Chlamydia sanziniae TaxID=1806891 RepID=UPI0009EEA93A|nr:autotransporter outer membrane beta-barrel domain-containing protein [Candidatus Chlamydia sanziniae]
MFSKEGSTSVHKRYRHATVGYAVGASTRTPEEHGFSFAFCQLFGGDKDPVVARNQTKFYGGALYFQHFGTLQDSPFLFSGQLTYGHTSNKMKTRYTLYPEAQGSWGNDAFGVELSGTTIHIPGYTRWFATYAPYLKLQLTYAHQEDFKETGTEGRTFEKSDLFNLALPMGMKFDKALADNKVAYGICLAYVPDLVRVNPTSTTTLVTSGFFWETPGIRLARQAFLAHASSHYAPNQTFEISNQCTLELRKSSQNYNIHLKGNLYF